MEIRAQQAPWAHGVNILISQGKAVVDNLTLTEPKDGEYVRPTFTLGPNEAQQLMDDLWMAGFRPTEGTGSAGALKAVENHLADMRRLVFDGIKIKETNNTNIGST